MCTRIPGGGRLGKKVEQPARAPQFLKSLIMCMYSFKKTPFHTFCRDFGANQTPFSNNTGKIFLYLSTQLDIYWTLLDIYSRPFHTYFFQIFQLVVWKICNFDPHFVYTHSHPHSTPKCARACYSTFSPSRPPRDEYTIFVSPCLQNGQKWPAKWLKLHEFGVLFFFIFHLLCYLVSQGHNRRQNHRLTLPKGVYSLRYFLSPMRIPNLLMHVFIMTNPFVICSCIYAFCLRIV